MLGELDSVFMRWWILSSHPPKPFSSNERSKHILFEIAFRTQRLHRAPSTSSTALSAFFPGCSCPLGTPLTSDFSSVCTHLLGHLIWHCDFQSFLVAATPQACPLLTLPLGFSSQTSTRLLNISLGCLIRMSTSIFPTFLLCPIPPAVFRSYLHLFVLLRPTNLASPLALLSLISQLNPQPILLAAPWNRPNI